MPEADMHIAHKLKMIVAFWCHTVHITFLKTVFMQLCLLNIIFRSLQKREFAIYDDDGRDYIFRNSKEFVCVNPGGCDSGQLGILLALHIAAMFQGRFMKLLNIVYNKTLNVIASSPGIWTVTRIFAVLCAL